MIFKERRYRCTQCDTETRRFAWDVDPAPICPTHQQALLEDWNRSHAPAVVDDTVIGGRICETIGHEPFYYESKSQLRKEAEKRGLINVVRHEESYYATQRKRHDEELRDLGRNVEY